MKWRVAFFRSDVTDKLKQDTKAKQRRCVEEHVARELLGYFTGCRPNGVKYENQPEEVKELWLGAARVAMKALQEVSS